MRVIEADNLTKRFGNLVAVDHVSFSVDEGEIFDFLGPNGAGKTTTINMLTTLLNPSEGAAKVGGFDVEKQEGNVREVAGLVPQDITIDDDLTGIENDAASKALPCSDQSGQRKNYGDLESR